EREPGHDGRGGEVVPDEGAGAGGAPVPGGRAGEPAGDAVRHPRAAEPVPGRQGRQGRQPHGADHHAGAGDSEVAEVSRNGVTTQARPEMAGPGCLPNQDFRRAQGKQTRIVAMAAGRRMASPSMASRVAMASVASWRASCAAAAEAKSFTADKS